MKNNPMTDERPKTEALDDAAREEGQFHYGLGPEHIGFLIRQLKREIAALTARVAVKEGTTK